ncbi:MAG: MFS transporter [Hyphomicrobiales bacterium]
MVELDKKFVRLRWPVLIMICLASFGMLYFLSLLYPLKETLIEEFSFTNYDFGFVFSVYAIPSIFLLMGIFAGILIDRFGARITGFVFSVLLIIGVLIIVYATTEFFNKGGPFYSIFDSFWQECSPAAKLMAVGLFFFGMGGESLFLVMTRLIINWFKGREIALAFALSYTFGKLGSSAGIALTPILKNAINWQFSLYVGLVVFLFTILAFNLLFILKKFNPKIDNESEDTPFKIKDLRHLIKAPIFIIFILVAVAFYAAYDPLIVFGSDLLKNEYLLSLEQSTQEISFLLILTALFSPVFGYLVDKKGLGYLFLIIGSFLLLIVFTLLLLDVAYPTVLMFIAGLALSLFASSIYPVIASSVDKRISGTAFGVISSAENLGSWVATLSIGYLIEIFNPKIGMQMDQLKMMTYDYSSVEILIIGFMALCVLFSILIYRNRSKKVELK